MGVDGPGTPADVDELLARGGVELPEPQPLRSAATATDARRPPKPRCQTWAAVLFIGAPFPSAAELDLVISPSGPACRSRPGPRGSERRSHPARWSAAS